MNVNVLCMLWWQWIVSGVSVSLAKYLYNSASFKNDKKVQKLSCVTILTISTSPSRVVVEPVRRIYKTSVNWLQPNACDFDFSN